MKRVFFTSVPLALTIFSVWLCFVCACGNNNPSLHAPGTVFIRQKAKDFNTFREALLGQRQNLKSHGFSAYSLHRDLNDSRVFIVTLKCSDLEKGVGFIRSSDFMGAMDQAGGRIPMVWYGLDITDWSGLKITKREYSNLPQMTGGIVIARNEVRDFKYWKACFYQESGGTHHHPGRKYTSANYSIHYLPGKPEVALVVHEASDVTKAPAFMTSDPMNGEMESTGVTGLEIWYGVNLEEGIF